MKWRTKEGYTGTYCWEMPVNEGRSEWFRSMPDEIEFAVPIVLEIVFGN